MIGRGTLLGLAVAAAAMSAAAAAVHWSAPDAAVLRIDAPALPALARDPGRAARLVVETADDTIVLAREAPPDGGAARWVMADRGGYPVRPEVAASVLDGLAALRLQEPKTARPELHRRLGVEGPAAGTQAAPSRSVLVAAEDADGGRLGALILGRPSPLAAVEPGLYVRRPEQERAWLAAGALTVPRRRLDWLDRRLLDLPAERFRQVSVEVPDRPRLVLRREEDGWRVATRPADRALDRPAAVDEVARALEGLDLTDVRPAADLAGALPLARTTFTAADGLAILVRLAADEGGAAWATFTVGWVQPEGAAAVAAAAARAETAALKARLEGWAFRLPPARADRLAVTLDDLADPPG